MPETLKAKPKFIRNFTGWADAAAAKGYSEFAKQMREDNQGSKSEILARVKSLGLPVQASRLVSMEAFLQDPSKMLEEFNYPLYWATVLPKDLKKPKFTKVGINAEELAALAISHQDKIEGYDFLMNEYEDNIYGGQIISNDHIVVLEMAEGKQQDVVQINEAHGKLYIAKRRLNRPDFGPADPAFIYSTEDPELRKTMWNVLNYLRPRHDIQHTVSDAGFMKGYFEFAVTPAPNRTELGVTFFDYKDSKLFTNIKQ